MSVALLPRDSFTTAQAAFGREWLVTNGIGGFAAGTVAQANARRYHGLLVAKIDAVVRYRGNRYELGCNEFADGTVAPRGFELLAGFRLEHQTPVWTFALADAMIEQRIFMPQGANTAYLHFTVRAASAAVDFELTPLCTYRDYHSHTQGGWSPGVSLVEHGVRIDAYPGARPYTLTINRGRFAAHADWYWRFAHHFERDRGLDVYEDLFRPGVFVAALGMGQSIAVTATAEPNRPADADDALRAHAHRHAQLLASSSADPEWIQRLHAAADQFIVARADAAGQRDGTTVIAGYPWFTDWGRDTMIALPGLTIATGRFDEAAAILRTFAAHISEGMLPNRFPDGGEAPEYNTVDATLWYFHAIDCYWRASGDRRLLGDLLPVLEDILRWHERGTRFGISVDQGDGLLRAGQSGVQLTWMDAKVGDWVVTPRIGKPVEINALWHFAHVAIASWQRALGDESAALHYQDVAERIRTSFRQRFWNEARGCLYDVIDGPDGQLDSAGRRVDASLRPNQIFAASLGVDLLGEQQARAVVDVCARELLTPVGLRSLAAGDPAYQSRYGGGPWVRDGAYHQGTVWSWLLGPFVLAHFRSYGDAAQALTLLENITAHLDEACVGQISEIFDAAAPHAPQGCFAQAWSVAEILRAYVDIRHAGSVRQSRRGTTAERAAKIPTITKKRVGHGQ